VSRSLLLLTTCLLTLGLSLGQSDAAPTRAKTSKSAKGNARGKAKAVAKRKLAVRPKTTNVKSGGLGVKGTALLKVRELTAKQNSKRGLRLPRLSLKPRKVKQLKYLRNEISEKQVATIQTEVDKLQAEFPNEVIVFRGQDTFSKKVQSQVIRELGPAKAAKEFTKAAKAEKQKATETVERVNQKAYPTKLELRLASHLGKATGEELLAIKSQTQFSSRFLISTTRDLSIAFGDFYKAPQVRYVYILQVPKEHAINLHGLVAEKTKAMNLPKAGNQREKELAIPLQATEFVRAVYDIKTNKVTRLK
jgi:hypothetical protein